MGNAFELGTLLLIAGGVMAYIGFQVFDFGSNQIFSIVLALAPIWAPIITFLLFFEYWLRYVQKKFDLEQGRVTLEIKLPQEIFKSPAAMELVLTQLYQTASKDNHLETYIDGKHVPTFSLEVVSRGGDVRFYVNVPRRKFKHLIETHLYAQYPGIEIVELPIDYTAEIPWDQKRFDYFTIHFNLRKEDALPIKTYIEYGLDEMPKEEEKVDPITPMLEYLGSIQPGEYLWYQILIKANKELTFIDGELIKKPDWKGPARKYIQTIIDEATKRVDTERTVQGMDLLTDTERQTVKAIERSLSKHAFDVIIRSSYIAKKELYNPSQRIGGMIQLWKPYDDINRNRIGFAWRTDYDWNIFQDPTGSRRRRYKRYEHRRYKARTYKKRNKHDYLSVMTTEELATIFHLPGRVALTPTLGRIPSLRSEAPPNLPISEQHET